MMKLIRAWYDLNIYDTHLHLLRLNIKLHRYGGE